MIGRILRDPDNIAMFLIIVIWTVTFWAIGRLVG